MTSATLFPTIRWCQRKDKVLLKLEARNPTKETVEFTDDNRLRYNADCLLKNYMLDLELFDEIDHENSGYKRIGFNMEIVIKKKEQVSWPRLTKENVKLSYVGVDWNNWVDSDDEDPEEDHQDFNFGPTEEGEANSDEDDEEAQNLDDLDVQEDVTETQK